MQSKYLRYRTLADGFSTLNSPLAERYADAAEALERLAADEGEAIVPSMQHRSGGTKCYTVRAAKASSK
jgi:hypothetical protein